MHLEAAPLGTLDEEGGMQDRYLEEAFQEVARILEEVRCEVLLVALEAVLGYE